MKPKILYLMTSNPDKVFEYQKLFELSNAPVIVQSADVILRDFYHAPEESESVEGNVEEKRDVLAYNMRIIKGLDSKGEPFKKDSKKYKKQHDLIRRIAENIEQLSSQYELSSDRLPKNPTNNLHAFKQSAFFNEDIYFGVEDSSIGAAPILLHAFDRDNIPKPIEDRIAASLRRAAKENQYNVEDPKHSVPGVEYAPTSAAIGTKGVVQRIHKAAELEGIQPEIASYSLLNMTNIKDAAFEKNEQDKPTFKQFRQYDGKSSSFILNKEPFLKSPHNGGINSYFTHPEVPLSKSPTEAEILEAYHKIYTSGSRATIVGDINKNLFGYAAFKEPQLKRKINSKRSVVTGFLDTDIQANNLLQQSALTTRPPHIKELFTESLNFVEKALDKVNIMVLPPTLSREADQDKDLKRFIDCYTLNSFVTAKMLIGRDKPKPIIIQNIVDETYAPEGCWHDGVDLHHHLVKNQMCRDANLDPTPWLKDALEKAGIKLPVGVSLQHNDYFTVLTGAAEAVHKASEALIEYWRPRLVKVNMPGQAHEHVRINTVEDDNKFKVGIFLSAGSENDSLLKSTSDFCAELARKDIGIVYGGGDQHLMGAIYDGVKEYADAFAEDLSRSEKPLLKAYSTHEILKTESKIGDFPDKDEVKNIQFFGKLCTDIYQRMGEMIAESDMLLFRPGGAGTMQELTAGLIIRKLHPELASGKPIIICDTKLHANEQQTFYSAVISHLFPQGNSAYQHTLEHKRLRGKEIFYEMISNHSGEAPIYITHDDATAQALIDEFHLPQPKLQPGHRVQQAQEKALQL